MIQISACEFNLGEESDAHAVQMLGFEIGKYPVTNRLFHRFVKDTQHKPPAHWVEGEVPVSLEDHPVVNVTWQEAGRYCAWMSEVTGVTHRLPTEAEWELTARGEAGTIYPWGDTFFADNCNCWEAGIGWTTPVNCFGNGATSLGCMDMAGNVWEWCSSAYTDYPYDASDGREESDGEAWRVLRGGSWFDHEWGVRAARRLSGDPQRPSHNTGFRIVRTD